MLLPDWLQTALLTVLLLVVVYKTAGKAQKQSAVERKARWCLTSYVCCTMEPALVPACPSAAVQNNALLPVQLQFTSQGYGCRENTDDKHHERGVLHEETHYENEHYKPPGD